MIFRKAVLFVAAVAVASSVSAFGQAGVYGMFTVDRLSNIVSSPIPPLSSQPQDARLNTADPLGGTGGIYYDFMKLGPIRLGADARGSILTTKRGAYVNFNGQGTKIYSVLGGVRGVFVTKYAPLKPYIQLSAGLGRSNYGLITPTTNNGQTVIHNNFEYEGLAGLDLKLLPILDWRVAELGYGGLLATGNLSHNYPIKQVSMGFVVHFP
ncbi:MAG TPA: hypothetical protein VNU92_14670 [Edaphobacter sp.]|jgi:hypothetical protein|nr:hypothetical protein [Edaphobacter sp.]